MKAWNLLALALVLATPGCGPAPEPTAKTSSTSVTESDKPDDMAENNPFAPKRIDYPAPGPILGFLGARSRTSLNGVWRAIVDPMGVGDPGSMFGGFPRNKQQRTGMELVEYDFESAQTLRVPGHFNTQDDRLFFYQGRVWYYRTFTAPTITNVRQHLHFGGVNFDATIFLNGKGVGEHHGGYVPFSFDVTEHLQPGENVLMVRVDNSLTAESVPTARTDWWPYGGLTRDVELVETPTAFIRNARVTLADRDSRTIRVEVDSEGFAEGTQVTISLPELSITETLRLAADGNGNTEFNAAVELWSPQAPRRYEVVLAAGEDRLVEYVGFRTIKTRGAEILLNGEAIKLRGISTHEEPIGEPGVAYSLEHARRILNEAKALNANFVRAAHYPYSRHMAEAADELGLMLWEEVPVYWNIAWENPATLDIARDQIDRLVRRDWNRASVIIWSVANETPLSEPRMTFLQRLIDDVRALDDSRLVSAALLGGGRKQFGEIIAHIAARALAAGGLSPEDKTVFEGVLAPLGDSAPGPSDTYTVVIDDPLGELTDVVAYNEYFGWYYSAFFSAQLGVGEDVLRPRMLELMRDMRIRASVDKPGLIHSPDMVAASSS